MTLALLIIGFLVGVAAGFLACMTAVLSTQGYGPPPPIVPNPPIPKPLDQRVRESEGRQ